MASIDHLPEVPDSGTPASRPRPQLEDGAEFVPVLLGQLQDDLARSRMREAFWISLLVHIVLIIAIALSPKYLPDRKAVVLVPAEELLRDREMTYLEAPPDRQKPPVKAPDTNKMSDKNRIATSRNPTLDKKMMEELRDLRRPGAPGPGGRPSPPVMQPPQQAQQSGQPQPQQQQQANSGPAAPTRSNENASLESMPAARRNPTSAFAQAMSPGSAIEQAARAAAVNRGGYGGASGEYGLGPTASQGKIRSDLDVLSDTQGVDFGPYLQRVLQSVRRNWYILIPEVARAPLMKKGKVSIQFVILPDGKVAGMQTVLPSGDIALDRAAWGGITNSNPFPPLPQEFRGPYLALRFHFYYNPEKNDIE
jgi:TonB family protein